MAHSSPTLQKTLSVLITANHILDHYALADAFGHISVRNPDDPTTFYMTGNLAPAFVASIDDLAHYNIADGSRVDPADDRSSMSPYSERFCHSGILKRYPNVNAVIHSHSRDVIMAGVSGSTLRPMYHMAGFLGDHVPVFDIADSYDGTEPQNLLVNSNKLGADIASSLSDGSYLGDPLPSYTVALQRGHGFTTWGESVEEAVYRAIYTQENAKIQMAATNFSAASLGEVKTKPLSKQEMKDTAALNKGTTTKAWQYWSRIVEEDPKYRNDLLNLASANHTKYRTAESDRMLPC